MIHNISQGIYYVFVRRILRLYGNGKHAGMMQLLSVVYYSYTTLTNDRLE